MAAKVTKIAICITVFNEAETIGLLVSALRHQTLSPTEVVITDGGSVDATFSLLHQAAKSWPKLKVFKHPGNRSVGRNFAVSHITCPIIAFTDAGCTPRPDWLEKLAQPFREKKTQIVSGYYEGQATTIFHACLIPFVLVMPDKAGRSEFYPATRSMALRRHVWNLSGGFDPGLFHNEDYAFAHHLKHLGFSFTFAPQAIVTWLPRKKLHQASWMFMRFAIGDIQAGIIRPRIKLLVIRYLVFIFGFFLLLEVNPRFILHYSFLIILAYSLWAIAKNYRYVKDPRAFFWLPVLQVTADLSVLFGSLVGLLSKAWAI